MSQSALTERPERDTRCRIIATAEAFFRTLGYQKTTVADIAKALKMSPANVYRFFDSKKSINEAVAARLMGEVEAAMEAIVERDAPAAERLRAFIEAGHRMNAERYVDALKMHEMVEVAMTESWDVVHGHIERVVRLLHRLIAEGQATGEFREGDAQTLALCVDTAVIRFFHPQLIAQCANEPGPTLEVMTDFVLAALGHRAV